MWNYHHRYYCCYCYRLVVQDVPIVSQFALVLVETSFIEHHHLIIIVGYYSGYLRVNILKL